MSRPKLIDKSFGKIPLNSGKFAPVTASSRPKISDHARRVAVSEATVFSSVKVKDKSSSSVKKAPSRTTRASRARDDMERDEKYAAAVLEGKTAGPGYGGPAKGLYEPFTEETAAEAARKALRARIAAMSERELVAELKANIAEIALGSKNESTRIFGSKTLLERTEGMPVSRNINVNGDDISDLDDDALIRRREALERGVGSGSARAVPKKSPPRTEDMVH